VTRVIRIIRLIRLIRIVKLYKQSQLAQNVVSKKKNNHAASESKQNELPEESKISKVLSDQQTRAVIVLVLTMLLIVQLVSPETYTQQMLFHEQGLRLLQGLYDKSMSGNGDSFRRAREYFIEQGTNEERAKFPLIFLETAELGGGKFIQEWEPKMETLRSNEYRSFSLRAND
jgi:hypothetical protein